VGQHQGDLSLDVGLRFGGAATIREAAPLLFSGFAALATALAIVSPAADARAAEALHLTWDACAFEAGASPSRLFACDVDQDTLRLHVGFTLAQPVSDAIGLELVVDVQFESPALPDWWRLEDGGCRAGALRVDADFGLAPGCADPWSGGGAAGFPSYTPGMPRGAPNQARIRAGVGVAPATPRSLAADTPYHAARLAFLTIKTTAGACPGCETRACLVLNSILIRRAPGAEADVFVTTPAPLDGNWALWQGTGAPCTQVPARRATWGAVKSLYR